MIIIVHGRGGNPKQAVVEPWHKRAITSWLPVRRETQLRSRSFNS